MHDHGRPRPDTQERVVRRSGRSDADLRGPGPVNALALQRTAGNAVVARLLGRASAPGDVVVQRGKGKGKASGEKQDKGKEVPGKGTGGKKRRKQGGKGKRGKGKGAEGEEKETEGRGVPRDTEHVPEYPGTLPQATIQERMMYACILLDKARGLGAATELAGWFTTATVNELCGGWVTLHRLRPDWLLPLWTSLSEWQFEGDKDTPRSADLDALVGELKKRSVESSPDRQIVEVARAMVLAWAVMNKLEPGAKYGTSPKALRELVGEPDLTDDWRRHDEWRATCRIADAGPMTAHEVRERVGGGSLQMEYYFHVETDHHHFGVHVSRGRSAARWTVCEPAKFGLAQIGVEHLAHVLGLGFMEGYTPAKDDDPEWARPKVGAKSPEQVKEMSGEERSEYHRELAGRQAELKDWRAERDRMEITFTMRTYTRPVRR